MNRRISGSQVICLLGHKPYPFSLRAVTTATGGTLTPAVYAFSLPKMFRGVSIRFVVSVFWATASDCSRSQSLRSCLPAMPCCPVQTLGQAVSIQTPDSSGRKHIACLQSLSLLPVGSLSLTIYLTSSVNLHKALTMAFESCQLGPRAGRANYCL